MSAPRAGSGLASEFGTAARKPKGRRKKRLAPVSVRLNASQRQELERAADGQSLNSFIKARLFSAKGKALGSNRRQPVRDQAALARALGLLGAMDLGDSLRILAKAAETGALSVTPETEEQLVNACAAFLAIKSELMRALGYDDTDAS